ncbi:hypothetical protein GCM10010912_60710 [Paenibacillus albidus]|uniref:Septum formation initiator family protein n=1 Tax=Paenibacillus albidus TaxID=2041023 RepID=A0A917D383_9BACL|nr:septum formation initiator family protein [Paenibacillus albidus]MBT2290066.1 septum formation initiator family protein [Paenibacillus albidus]GGG07961.1 hypothetical protein GCM10010912_60710 [Paenibacillus albidus]
MNRFSAEEKEKAGNNALAAGAKRRRFIWVFSVVVFFAWAGYTFIAQNTLITDKSQLLAEKQESQKNVTASLNQLKYEVTRLNNDEYIGQLARKWYNMYPKGETAIRTEQTE